MEEINEMGYGVVSLITYFSSAKQLSWVHAR
jgi:hypothetical protein